MARRRRRTQDPPPQRLILDAGAVIALSRADRRARAVLVAAREARVRVSIPSVVVAETVRGVAGDAPVNRVLTAVGEVDAADEAIGRTAGRLLGDAGSSATVDAVVVATAVAVGGAVVLTGDPDDLSALADGHPEVVIEAL
ncbi:MAG: PIN domain-containing protein [Acidimicrobiia bacterium]